MRKQVLLELLIVSDPKAKKAPNFHCLSLVWDVGIRACVWMYSSTYPKCSNLSLL